MIEVEKKFSLSKEEEERLIRGAEFLGEKTFTDTYYDYPDYSLSLKDIWLRERDGRLELKVPMNVAIEERVSDQYREIETNEEIKKYLDAPKNKALAQFLSETHCAPYCTLTTTRKKYKKNGFGIDLDSVDFGYTIAEIECMTDDESKIGETTEKIIKYAEAHDIALNRIVRGKVAEYLRRNDPQHFEALIRAKVIK